MKGDVSPCAGSSVVASIVPSPMTTEPLATSSASADNPAPKRLGRGFSKLENKKLIGIYADWIDEEVDYLK